ncbi:DNA-binding transcriptional regulator, HxlR family [Nocardiopsis flavescens]|uniref:DNA-binding transcriptional regulator, HxlR family n=1 Tax=Nocardiopsis flavescens TaxID=758803 RepID=A0A1M6B2C6_9ACTN|nr:helix-turn-helix domain-containing protein [Nocardiopsis flavescens]SHI42856.1 DNA-binding transcriptional regulator, HxlR family [Nocardiopsis flavescens]
MSGTHTRVPTGLGAGPVNPEDCPVREVLDRIGDKWSVLVIVLLGRRTHRYGELHRTIDGISQRMLTLTLRALVRDGLVERTAHATVPPRVEYSLTGLGRTLLEPLTALDRWAVEHRDDIRGARERHDREQART